MNIFIGWSQLVIDSSIGKEYVSDECIGANL